MKRFAASLLSTRATLSMAENPNAGNRVSGPSKLILRMGALARSAEVGQSAQPTIHLPKLTRWFAFAVDLTLRIGDTFRTTEGAKNLDFPSDSQSVQKTCQPKKR